MILYTNDDQSKLISESSGPIKYCTLVECDGGRYYLSLGYREQTSCDQIKFLFQCSKSIFEW